MSLVILLFITAFVSISHPTIAADVVYAVNAGGTKHVDSNGIEYVADTSRVGVPSDYGTRFNIRRVAAEDQALYQTERWHHESFSYEVPVKKDGDYVLVLKFAEVYFNSPDQKVFNVQLNKKHTVISNLDIFDKVGHGTAHDEIVPFQVKNGKVLVGGEESAINGNSLSVTFAKGNADNPKICAFYLMRGKKEDVIPLPPLDLLSRAEEEEEDEDEDGLQEEGTKIPDRKTSAQDQARREKLKSGPPAINPYAEDNSSLILPIIIAFCAFIPTLLCLCRL